MSLPTDVQNMIEALTQVLIDHDLGSISISAKVGNGFPRGSVSVSRGKTTWDTGFQAPETVGHLLQEKIRQSIKATEDSQEAIRAQIKDGEKALALNDAAIESFRNLIPPPLIELAQCAEDVDPNKLNWLNEDDLPF